MSERAFEWLMGGFVLALLMSAVVGGFMAGLREGLAMAAICAAFVGVWTAVLRAANRP